jgi:hypothetical protein
MRWSAWPTLGLSVETSRIQNSIRFAAILGSRPSGRRSASQNRYSPRQLRNEAFRKEIERRFFAQRRHVQRSIEWRPDV